MNYKPSYDEYRKILKDIKASGKLMDYKEALSADEFLILRHDVEFSLERAYRMAQVEAVEKVASTYFVQITNNSYNALSMQNRKRIKEISDMGHKIGLHYHLNQVTDPLKTRDGIRDQIRIMSEMCGISIDRFSIHRPVREVYYNSIPIEGMINAYSSEFFTLTEEGATIKEEDLEVKYIADSRHRWNYGYPDVDTFSRNRKIQLLIHPDFWSEEGCDAKRNFEKLIEENITAYIQTLDGECKHFSGFKDEMSVKYGTNRE
ncbi:MAG: hypothetical protein HFI76_09860 [Lachnospiraceae bacterium]|jgi:hypothetical protein|nr:hypothetical protein [Lachnospiraceae bacterium]